MNWKQLYTSATEEERLTILLHMLQTIEARQNKIIFTGNNWVRNRRRINHHIHLINERRGRHLIARIASIITILAALFAVSTATTLIILHAPINTAMQLIFFPISSILFIFLFKPRRVVKVNHHV
jgi:hypothetical protein